jgi:predicted porin
MTYPTLRRGLKSVLAAAACATLAPTALAQSSVQIFGTVDLNLTSTKAGGTSNNAMEQGANIFPSRIGFRGTEDLGGGLSASFWLESALLPDTGQIQGAFFSRRSTVSLASQSLGELRLGRDYTPTFWNLSQFSPFGTVGVGGSSNIIEGWPFGVGGARTLVRSDNSIGYFTPKNLGGFYGQAMMTMDEGTAGAKYRGLRVGYAAGAFDVAGAYGATDTPSGRYKTSSLGGTYNLSFAKLFANYYVQQVPSDKQTNIMLGATIPVGPGDIKVSVAQSNRSGPGLDPDDASQMAIGYVHRLSKRTSLYTMYSRISNKGAAAFVTADSSPAATPGGSATGFQVGISHNF